MKICILLGSGFPVPAVSGGAIETLLEMILEKNQESDDNTKITIITKKSTHVDYSKYDKINFVFVPCFYIIFEKLYWKIYGLIKKMFRKEIIAPLPRVYERRFINKNIERFDYFVEETSLNVFKGLNIPREKVIYHLHYAGEKEIENDELFGDLISISNYISQNWIKQTNRCQSKTHVLKNCIDTDRFSKSLFVPDSQKDSLKRSLGIRADNRIVLYIGRIVPEKGILELIQAFNCVNHKNVSLLIVGSANFSQKTMTFYEKAVSKAIEESNKQIISTGFVHNSELYKYHAIADLAVIPSVWQEPAGLVELEFQAAGVPIIATRVGGIPEFVSEECIMVDTENLINNLTIAIDDVIDNDIKLKCMRDAGMEFVKEFGKDRYYKELTRILGEIDNEN